MPSSDQRPDAAERIAAREPAPAIGDVEGPAAGGREGAILGLHGLLGNRAVGDLLALEASGGDAGAEIEALTLAAGAVHPALQRASAALRRPTGLFGTAQRTAASRPAGTPEFATESADKLLHAGTVKPAKHSGFPATMGQTAYERSKIEIWPSFNVTYGTPFWHWLSTTATPQKTTASGGTWWAIATPANEQGYKMPDERPEYPGLEYYIKVSSAAADMIAKAEQQHINDLDQGWAITGAATAAAINATAEEEPDVSPSKPAAKQAAANKVASKLGAVGERIKGGLRSGGRLEDSLGPLMDGSATASAAARDATGKHTIPIRFVEKDEKQKRVVFEVNDSFKLDETASETVVTAGTVGA